MDNAALVFRVRKNLMDRLQHTAIPVTDDEPDAGKAPFFEPDKEVVPALVVFLHAFGSTEDLAITVLIDADRDKYGDVLDFAAPAALQVNTVYIDIGVFAGERAAAPLLDVFVGFLIEVADCTRGYTGSPQGLGDILDPADRNTGQVHLDQGFLNRGLTTAVTLNDGCFKLNALELWNMECDVAGSCCKVTVIMAKAITSAVTGTFVTLCVDKFIGFMLSIPAHIEPRVR